MSMVIRRKSLDASFDFYPRHITFNHKYSGTQYALSYKKLSNYLPNMPFYNDTFNKLINNFENARVFRDCLNQQNGINPISIVSYINRTNKNQKLAHNHEETSDLTNIKLQSLSELIVDEELLAHLNEIIENHNIENITNILKGKSNNKYAKFLLVAILDLKTNTSMNMSSLDKEIINALAILFYNTINKSSNDNQSIFAKIKDINNIEDKLISRQNNYDFDKLTGQKIALELNQVVDTIENQIISMTQQVENNYIENLNQQYYQLIASMINLIKLSSTMGFNKLKAIQDSKLLDKDTSTTKHSSSDKTIDQILAKIKSVSNEKSLDAQVAIATKDKFLVKLVTNKIINNYKEEYNKSTDKLASHILSFILKKELSKHYLSLDELLKNKATNSNTIIVDNKNILESLGKLIGDIKREFESEKCFAEAYKPYKINYDDKISIISNINNIIGKETQRQHVLLSLPDSPILTRNSYINKKDKKRKRGENKCPCGSGKQLRYCCGADNKYQDDDN